MKKAIYNKVAGIEVTNEHELDGKEVLTDGIPFEYCGSIVYQCHFGSVEFLAGIENITILN